MDTTFFKTIVDQDFKPVQLRFAWPYAEFRFVQKFLNDMLLDFTELLRAVREKRAIGCKIAGRIMETVFFSLMIHSRAMNLVSLQHPRKLHSCSTHVISYYLLYSTDTFAAFCKGEVYRRHENLCIMYAIWNACSSSRNCKYLISVIE